MHRSLCVRFSLYALPAQLYSRRLATRSRLRLRADAISSHSEWSTYREVQKDPISNGQARRIRYERPLGPTEVSYYLGSRGKGLEGGVNDM